jgi:[glutamine synthetase] adenylyltransferase / [glutamine synthetase]-adenylyl-L-tyrosine phosphorylase
MTKLTPLPFELAGHLDAHWEKFTAAIAEQGIVLPEDPGLTSVLRQAFACSDFVAKTCTRFPQMLFDLAASGDLERIYDGDAHKKRLGCVLGAVKTESELMRVVREFRRREMVRIAIRDLAGRADLHETVSDLSSLADACLDQALALLYRWNCLNHGTPVSHDGTEQRLIVVGMGKLGARELNFSSDVDLILAYPQPGQTRQDDGGIGNEAFFQRLGRQLVKVIGNSTADGIAFRVDMNLRPYGENGPLVMNFDAMEDYFQSQGREWERYAWIKARTVAGDKAAGHELLQRLKPFIYRRYLDYGVFESLRDMKRMITREVRRKGIKGNIKLGAGGIREIEFFGQMFQLIRGGVLPELQERQILNILAALVEKELVPAKTCAELSAAYVFLRNTEHRLQIFADQQTHELPIDKVGRIRLAFSMGYDDWEQFRAELSHHMDIVHHHFVGLLQEEGATSSGGADESREDRLEELWHGSTPGEIGVEVLETEGYQDPDRILRLLDNHKTDGRTRALSPTGKSRLDRLMPRILKAAGTAPHPDSVLTRILDLVMAIQRRTSYLSLLLENPMALAHLVKLAEASPFIISYLTRHPVLLDELLDPRHLYVPPEMDDLQREIKARLAKITDEDLEYLIEEVNIFKQVNTLRVAAADVSGALPLMKVSDRLTWIAETVVDTTLDLAWRHLAARHGSPTTQFGGRPLDTGFVVIAYGKLGGIELGYGSDLDLVFLHAGAGTETRGGPRPIAETQFYVRLGQRIIHLLTAHTSAGALYPVDMRLRPSGEKGILVIHIEGFRDYQLNEAWTWEHQALVRARPICGDPVLAERFQQIRAEVLSRSRDAAQLREQVREMRERMRTEKSPHRTDMFDVKNSRGGIIDIEFLVQYLVLLQAGTHPELLEWTDNVRLIQTLIEAGTFGDREAHLLKEAYLSFRSTVHRRNLQEKPAHLPRDQFKMLRDTIAGLWDNFMQAPK